MSSEAIKLFLNKKIGLNPDSVGESSIQRAISHRLSQLNIDNVSQYHALLLNNLNEQRELIEEIVVPETWFFRNKRPFEAFNQVLSQHILPNRNKKKKLRILSIPCSTGEEPYSLAIILSERGMSPKDVEITAVDISRQAIAKAKCAVYSEKAFRDTDESRIRKYFLKLDNGYKVINSLQKYLKFRQGNIFMGSLSPYPGYFDIIFCRNLLIYFDREKQQIALEKLHRAITKSGALFVGHAESSMVSDKYFSQLNDAKAFSFLKKSFKKSSPNINGTSRSKESNSRQLVKAKEQLSNINKEAIDTKNSQQLNRSLLTNEAGSLHQESLYTDAPFSFRPVEKLIEEEKYQDALSLCESFLEKDKSSAQGYYLMALSHNMTGEVKKAQSLLKKAVYLDQNHEAALKLSSELAEQEGDTDAIASFQRRIERLKKQSKDIH